MKPKGKWGILDNVVHNQEGNSGREKPKFWPKKKKKILLLAIISKGSMSWTQWYLYVPSNLGDSMIL